MRFLKLIAIFILLSLVIITSTFPINNPDAFHYLASGKYILEHGLPQDCVFIYTLENCTLVYSEWLYHVFIYLIYSLSGFFGLVIFQILTATSIFLILLIHAKSLKYSFFSTSFFFLFTAIAATERFILRAGTFALLLTVLFYTIFSKLVNLPDSKENKKRNFLLFISLVIIQILWVNTHGSFPLSFGIIGTFLLSYITQILWKKYKNNAIKPILVQQLKKSSFVLAVIIIVSILNPYGLKAFLFPFEYFLKSNFFYIPTEHVSPFFPQDYTRLNIYSYKILLVSVVLILILNLKSANLSDLFILLPFLYLSTQAIRYVALFAVFSLAILPKYLDNIVHFGGKFVEKKSLKHNKIFSYIPLPVYFAILLFSVKLTIDIITNQFYLSERSSRRFGFGVSELRYPQKVAGFIKQYNLEGNIFNDYTTGAFVNWLLFPDRQSFIHGHILDQDLRKEYFNILSGKTSLEKAVKKHNINLFLLSHIYPETHNLISRLYQDENWILVYLDELTAIFISNSSQNKSVIDKFAIDFTNNKNFNSSKLQAISKKVNLSDGFAARSVFLATIGFYNQAEQDLKKAINLNSNNFTAYNNLCAIYISLNQISNAFRACQKSITITSKYAPSHYNLARVYQKMNLLDGAVVEYRNTLNINKRYRSGNYNLARIFEFKRDIVKAMEYYQKELKYYSSDIQAKEAISRLKSPR